VSGVTMVEISRNRPRPQPIRAYAESASIIGQLEPSPPS
jgi:hypothetical protein